MIKNDKVTSISREVFQVNLCGNEEEIKARFCELLSLEISQMTSIGWAQFLSNIVFTKADKRIDITFSFWQH